MPIASIVGIIAIHLAVFFVCALLCHGELARRRPAPRFLTAYYMWISAGGTIGGIATGLIAPHVFNWVAEYPILIVLAALCRPGLALPTPRTGQYSLFIGLAAAALFLVAIPTLELNVDYSLYPVLVGVFLGVSLGILAHTAAVRRHPHLPFRLEPLLQ